MIILIILIILVLLSFNLFRNLFKNDTTILDDVKLKESEPSNNGFALMLQKSDGSGYEESDSNTWPTGMKFNSELSGCIDINGNKIENSLSFDTTNNLVNVSVGETAYCYVYFDIKKFCEDNETLSSCIIRNSNEDVEEIWNMTAEIGIDVMDVQEYRYVGTNPSNYICFGTTDKDICLNDTDKYMYRIIGVFEDTDGNKHTKLIKKEALNTAYVWNEDYRSNVDWNNSDLYNGLQESYFLTNTSYPYMQDSAWTDKIATWNYTMTNTKTISHSGPDYNTITTQNIYLHELNRSGKTSSIGIWTNLSTKISLMYASDYQLSLGSSTLSYTGSYSNAGTLKTGWIHISNNDSGTPANDEWTMTRSGDYGRDFYAWSEDMYGFLNSGSVDCVLAVRPVFYLTSDVELSSGTGTISEPFVLKN